MCSGLRNVSNIVSDPVIAANSGTLVALHNTVILHNIAAPPISVLDSPEYIATDLQSCGLVSSVEIRNIANLQSDRGTVVPLNPV